MLLFIECIVEPQHTVPLLETILAATLYLTSEPSVCACAVQSTCHSQQQQPQCIGQVQQQPSHIHSTTALHSPNKPRQIGISGLALRPGLPAGR